MSTADVITGFLHAFGDQSIETPNSVQTRNHRLAALQAFFAYAALWHPEHAATLPADPRHTAQETRHHHRGLPRPSEFELTALVNAPDTTTWEGRRDQLFITLAVHTGLRVTELLSLTPTSSSRSR